MSNNAATMKLIENMMRSGQISTTGTSGRGTVFKNTRNTHFYNEICNDGFCAIWAAFQALGVINKSDSKKIKIQKIIEYVLTHPKEFTEGVKNQLLELLTENGPEIVSGGSSSGWTKHKYQRVSDPRTIAFHAKKNIQINRQKPVEVSRRPARNSKFQMPNRARLIVFVHNGTHWGLARPI